MIRKEAIEMKRKDYIGIPVSEEEKSMIEAEASSRGMTLAAYCRWKLMEIVRKLDEPKNTRNEMNV